MIPNILMISTLSIVLLSITGVLLILVIVLYFLGKKMDKRQKEQERFVEANKQTISMFVTDKKKVRFKDAGFPQSVMDQAPKMSRVMKVPVVKAKVGPQFVTLISDDKIFDQIPVNKEIKATISGMYLVSFKLAHGKLEPVPKKKKNFFKRAVDKLQEKAGAKPIK